MLLPGNDTLCNIFGTKAKRRRLIYTVRLVNFGEKTNINVLLDEDEMTKIIFFRIDEKKIIKFHKSAKVTIAYRFFTICHKSRGTPDNTDLPRTRQIHGITTGRHRPPSHSVTRPCSRPCDTWGWYTAVGGTS